MPRRGENIRKRKDGRWEGRYSVMEPLSGRHITHSVYARTYGEVKDKLAEAKRTALNPPKEKVTEVYFGTIAKEWLATVHIEKKHATYIKYRTVYEKHIRKKLEGVLASELNSAILEDIFQVGEQESLSSSLQKSISCVLNQIFAYAASHYCIKLQKYSRPRRRTAAKPVEILNQTEQTKLLKYLYNGMDIHKLGIIICISTGLRLGEICSLKWKDIDFEEKVLYVNTTVQRIAVENSDTKTILLEGTPKSIFSKREIPLSDELVSLLASYHCATGEYVVGRKKPMEPRTYQNKFQKYLRVAEVKKKNFHALRHTFATNCINSGVDAKSLSEILGHSDVKITLNRYVHPTIETKRQYMNSLCSIYGQFVGQ
ncbi:MAG: site-specific integrase [Lachnospiraceae bacterium]|nr:site-specific integrase [Lachnospiraceae bacterium]